MNDSTQNTGASCPPFPSLKLNLRHWWRDKPWRGLKNGGLKLDVAKSALIYEAMRRRREIQEMKQDNPDWPNEFGFIQHVICNLPKAWCELDEGDKNGLVEAMQFPWFEPPRGYSVFPNDREAQKKASFHRFRVPNPDAPESEIREFVARAKRFEDAGFAVVAVDKKTNMATQIALAAIKELEPYVRRSDCRTIATFHIPPDMPLKERQAWEKKVANGTATEKDCAELWRKYRQVSGSPATGWHKMVTCSKIVANKRHRKGQPIEEMKFSWDGICQEIEDFDNEGKPSEFIDRQSVTLPNR